LSQTAHDRQSIRKTIGCDLTISFASAGNSLSYLRGGWACAEQDFTWTIGTESQFVLPHLDEGVAYVLSLDVVPFVYRPALLSQALTVRVGGIIVGSANLSRPALLTFRIPADLVRRSDRLLVTLQHPDAARPTDLFETPDSRQLALAVSEVKVYRCDNLNAGGRKCLLASQILGPSEQGSGTSGDAKLTEWAIRP